MFEMQRNNRLHAGFKEKIHESLTADWELCSGRTDSKQSTWRQSFWKLKPLQTAMPLPLFK